MSVDMVTPNVRRKVLDTLQTWGAAQDPAIRVQERSVRGPLRDDEDEVVILRHSAMKRRKTRAGQYRGVFVFEFHVVSKRGDLRSDRKTDRPSVIAALLEREFQEKDISIFNWVEGQPAAPLGTLQFDDASWRNGDQRATIFGASVDYTMETPKVEHIVLTYIAFLNTA